MEKNNKGSVPLGIQCTYLYTMIFHRSKYIGFKKLYFDHIINIP